MKPSARSRGLVLVTDPLRAEASLWRRLRYEADGGCRETLFDRYFVLARAVAARLFRTRARRCAERGDFDQFACEGLLQAIDRYDPLRGVPFSAYARRRIIGNIVGGAAQMDEIGAQLSYRRRIERERMASVASGEDDPLAALGDMAIGLALGLMLEGSGMIASDTTIDTRPDAYDSLAWRQTQALLVEEVERLPQAEARVIRYHYHAGLPFAQIAEVAGLSRGRIAQLHRAALDRLRRRLRSF